MPPKRGTPGYTKWKNSPEYENWCKNRSGEKNPNFEGKSVTDYQREKASERLKETTHTEDWCKNQSEKMLGKMAGEKHPMFGKHHTEESKKKIGEKSKIFMNSEKAKQIVRAPVNGENNPMYGKTPWNKGLKLPQCSGENHPLFGKPRPDVSERNKLLSGEKHPRWMGGISFEPYCIKFNEKFKSRVRHFFENKCVECGRTREEEGKELAVHHVNYDKMMCCNDVKPLFVTLCNSHNAKANNNREYWEKHYTDIINEKYNGQCYLPRND